MLGNAVVVRDTHGRRERCATHGGCTYESKPWLFSLRSSDALRPSPMDSRSPRGPCSPIPPPHFRS